jgi:7-carboxy-7-deazaguanine synthase
MLIVDWTETEARRLAPLATKPPGTLLVHEIYASIQGESTFAGLPCVFVRLTGCHLRCRWCDTAHAFVDGRVMTAADVLAEVVNHGIQLVEVTGGEPLAHPEAIPLMRFLADAGNQVLLETSGSLPIDAVDPRVHIICDLKCPSSGEIEANNPDTIRSLKPTDEIKFVVGSRMDFDWAMQSIDQFGLRGRTILFAPVWGRLADADLCAWIVESKAPVRFQPQLHKIVWGANKRGV